MDREGGSSHERDLGAYFAYIPYVSTPRLPLSNKDLVEGLLPVAPVLLFPSLGQAASLI